MFVFINIYGSKQNIFHKKILNIRAFIHKLKQNAELALKYNIPKQSIIFVSPYFVQVQ